MTPKRAPRNRTLTLSPEEETRLAKAVWNDVPPGELPLDRVICADMEEVAQKLPNAFVDLLILDPPYNLDKVFAQKRFSARSDEAYLTYLESWFPLLLRLLKPTASVYLCCDWHCSSACEAILKRFSVVRNRITWQREKGRGAKANWKNCSEDIWFATVGKSYTFNLNAVKQRRRVLAPYKTDGAPKDWQENGEGKFRDTAPSNFWDDLTVPYWSMPENTDHPTQKPEKLLAKLILASSNPGDVVLDPFLGSGTTAAVAQKLGRHFVGIEREMEYCLWAQARLERAIANPQIQGYENGIFYERNSQLSHKK